MLHREKKELLDKVLAFARKPFKVKDEPYMEFYAETTTMSVDYHCLWVTYCAEVNGVVCQDPLIQFFVRNGNVEKIMVANDLPGTHVEVAPDDEYPWEFLRLTWERHMKDRVPKVTDAPLSDEGMAKQVGNVVSPLHLAKEYRLDDWWAGLSDDAKLDLYREWEAMESDVPELDDVTNATLPDEIAQNRDELIRELSESAEIRPDDHAPATWRDYEYFEAGLDNILDNAAAMPDERLVPMLVNYLDAQLGGAADCDHATMDFERCLRDKGREAIGAYVMEWVEEIVSGIRWPVAFVHTVTGELPFCKRQNTTITVAVEDHHGHVVGHEVLHWANYCQFDDDVCYDMLGEAEQEAAFKHGARSIFRFDNGVLASSMSVAYGEQGPNTFCQRHFNQKEEKRFDLEELNAKRATIPDGPSPSCLRDDSDPDYVHNAGEVLPRPAPREGGTVYEHDDHVVIRDDPEPPAAVDMWDDVLQCDMPSYPEPPSSEYEPSIRELEQSVEVVREEATAFDQKDLTADPRDERQEIDHTNIDLTKELTDLA